MRPHFPQDSSLAESFWFYSNLTFPFTPCQLSTKDKKPQKPLYLELNREPGHPFHFGDCLHRCNGSSERVRWNIRSKPRRARKETRAKSGLFYGLTLFREDCGHRHTRITFENVIYKKIYKKSVKRKIRVLLHKYIFLRFIFYQYVIRL